MYEYELHKVMQAELIRRADAERLAREARRADRAARSSARQERGGKVSADRERQRFAHAA
ncbi:MULTISPECIES: hypothetical protein [unclassified Streptomyces]|uniref:hypothetical protein n=1 Tax=unclassified Streptomyces TaxID=2593676 RepID=UPI0037F6CF36